MSIRPKWLKDFCSVLFAVYYIIYAHEADEKVSRNVYLASGLSHNLIRSYVNSELSRLSKCSARLGRRQPIHMSVWFFQCFRVGPHISYADTCIHVFPEGYHEAEGAASPSS